MKLRTTSTLEKSAAIIIASHTEAIDLPKKAAKVKDTITNGIDVDPHTKQKSLNEKIFGQVVTFLKGILARFLNCFMRAMPKKEQEESVEKVVEDISTTAPHLERSKDLKTALDIQDKDNSPAQNQSVAKDTAESSPLALRLEPPATAERTDERPPLFLDQNRSVAKETEEASLLALRLEPPATAERTDERPSLFLDQNRSVAKETEEASLLALRLEPPATVERTDERPALCIDQNRSVAKDAAETSPLALRFDESEPVPKTIEGPATMEREHVEVCLPGISTKRANGKENGGDVVENPSIKLFWEAVKKEKERLNKNLSDVKEIDALVKRGAAKEEIVKVIEKHFDRMTTVRNHLIDGYSQGGSIGFGSIIHQITLFFQVLLDSSEVTEFLKFRIVDFKALGTINRKELKAVYSKLSSASKAMMLDAFWKATQIQITEEELIERLLDGEDLGIAGMQKYLANQTMAALANTFLPPAEPKRSQEEEDKQKVKREMDFQAMKNVFMFKVNKEQVYRASQALISAYSQIGALAKTGASKAEISQLIDRTVPDNRIEFVNLKQTLNQGKEALLNLLPGMIHTEEVVKRHQETILFLEGFIKKEVAQEERRAAFQCLTPETRAFFVAQYNKGNPSKNITEDELLNLIMTAPKGEEMERTIDSCMEAMIKDLHS